MARAAITLRATPFALRRHPVHTRPLSLRPLALAILLATSGLASAQSNVTGSVYGSAQPGQTVVIRNADTGLTRTISL